MGRKTNKNCSGKRVERNPMDTSTPSGAAGFLGAAAKKGPPCSAYDFFVFVFVSVSFPIVLVPCLFNGSCVSCVQCAAMGDDNQLVCSIRRLKKKQKQVASGLKLKREGCKGVCTIVLLCVMYIRTNFFFLSFLGQMVGHTCPAFGIFNGRASRVCSACAMLFV